MTHQQEIAEHKVTLLNAQQSFEQPIVTSVKAKNNFYSAESYHQNYVTNNPENNYCELVVAKKIQKFLNAFLSLLKEEDLMAVAI
ncbi:MAG: peptide-methionine (S)-S-oxide reductase [Psychroserpens sp.]|jgi:peptide-methionine (S)-S-oxide reductase